MAKVIYKSVPVYLVQRFAAQLKFKWRLLLQLPVLYNGTSMDKTEHSPHHSNPYLYGGTKGENPLVRSVYWLGTV